jgi:hypothetical protein
MKVHIIGLPSSGKTTLAKGLSSQFGVPHHDLDAVVFVDEQWTLRAIPDRDELVAQILATPGFVTEGGLLAWTAGFLAAADHIVWLDPPLRILIWRHVRRHGRLFHPRWVIARLRFQILSYIRPAGSGPSEADPDQTRSGIELALRPWADKVVRLRQGVTTAELMRRVRPMRGEGRESPFAPNPPK